MAYIPLIARIESLPPLPESIMQIEKLFASGDPDIKELVKIIESDPLLTTDVLARANAPYYGFSKTIISVLQAVTLLGAPNIRAFLLASAIERNFDVDLTPYDITTAMFSKISTMQSTLTFQWYMGVNIEVAKSITPIAFLMETGKILIAKDVIEKGEVDNFLDDLHTYDDIDFVENKYTMMTTAQINALIFEHLNLNETFYTTMKYLDHEKDAPLEMQEAIAALRTVRSAVNVLEQFTPESLQKATAILKEHNAPTEGFLRAAKRVQSKFME